jgi:hypothetical protein
MYFILLVYDTSKSWDSVQERDGIMLIVWSRSHFRVPRWHGPQWASGRPSTTHSSRAESHNLIKHLTCHHEAEGSQTAGDVWGLQMFESVSSTYRILGFDPTRAFTGQIPREVLIRVCTADSTASTTWEHRAPDTFLLPALHCSYFRFSGLPPRSDTSYSTNTRECPAIRHSIELLRAGHRPVEVVSFVALDSSMEK